MAILARRRFLVQPFGHRNASQRLYGHVVGGPGDTVLDPFNGIGSTGYVALGRRRRYIGIELKPSYFRTAVSNLRKAETARDTPRLDLKEAA